MRAPTPTPRPRPTLTPTPLLPTPPSASASATATASPRSTLTPRSCYSPTVGAFTEWGSVFVEPAFGFAIGFNYVLMIGMALASELSAFAILIGYWDKATNHIGAYIAAALVGCLLLNVVGVK